MPFFSKSTALSKTSSRQWGSVLPVSLLCLLLSGCISTWSSPARTADRYFDAGAYARAAQAYQSLVDSGEAFPDRDRAIYQLAFSYFIRSNPQHDPAAAHKYFTLLEQEYPQSPYTPRARTLLDTMEQGESVQARLELERRRSKELLNSLETLRRHLDFANSAALESDNQTAGLYRELDQQKLRLQELNKELAASSHRIRKLTEELEEIKKLDLADPP